MENYITFFFILKGTGLFDAYEVYADGVIYNGQTQKGTYTISTKEQLNTLSQKVNSGTTYEDSTFVLQNNIDFGKQTVKDYENLVANFVCIGSMNKPFKGTLDGNNKKISNIVIEITGQDMSGYGKDDNTRVYIGFIGNLEGTIKNLEITAFRQTDSRSNRKWHGILVGVNNGTIENCYIAEDDEHIYIDSYYHDGRLRHQDRNAKSMVWINNGDIINSHNKYSFNIYSSWTDYESGILPGSGIIASYNYGNIKNCSNIADDIYYYADRITNGFGGISYMNYGIIENCFNISPMSGDMLCGIAVRNEPGGIVRNSYNSGDMITYNSAIGKAGIVYYNHSLIEYCYNEGSLGGSGMEQGGIVASNIGGTVRYCYNSGSVSGYQGYGWSGLASVGGIASSHLNGGIIEYCYNSANISGENAGGLVGDRNGVDVIKNSYNSGTVRTNDPKTDEYSGLPMKDGFLNNGGLVGFNLVNHHINSRPESEYKRVIEGEYIGPEDHERFEKTKDYGLYLGNYDITNIINTYYYQYSNQYSASGHAFKGDVENKWGSISSGFTDIHGTDKTLGRTLEQMQSQAFVDLLNAGGEKVFVRDTGDMKVNNGFPIFKWQQVVTGIEVVGDKNIEENLFNTFTLNTLPAEIEDITFSWKANDESIVNIIIVGNGKSAVINGLKKGFTTITVTANDKNKYSVSFMVRVVSPSIQGKEGYYLVGEEIEYTTGYYDEETDPKYRDEFKYIHTDNRLEVGINLDNTLGTINYNNKWFGDSVNSFSKVGAYEVNYRVQDNPPTANKLNFENYRYYSEQVSTTIYIHRKPIAYYSINNNKVTYESYDLDHSVSYSNKSIIKWEWTYVNEKGNFEKYITTNKNDGQNKVNSWLSTYLNTNYELLLRVQDMELTWSDVYSTNQVAKIQFNANLRTELEKFSLNNVPASEKLLAFDIWTKYPKDLKLQLVLCNELGLEVAPIKEINYSTTTAIKMGHEIYWNDILYNIPATLISGNYIMKINAVDVLNPLIFESIDFNVTIKTPIELQPIMLNEIRAGKETIIKVNTSKYVNSAYSGSGVKVILFDGTSYARTLIMNGTTTNWNITATLDKTIPQGIYKAKFIATLPSGNMKKKK